MPRFVIRRPGEGAHVFELLGERPISIGRAKSSTLVLDHGSVSRQHASFRLRLKAAGRLLTVIARTG
jgi:pSer/pThr/pTyr-binding forkhead associated (FHA) protein